MKERGYHDLSEDMPQVKSVEPTEDNPTAWYIFYELEYGIVLLCSENEEDELISISLSIPRDEVSDESNELLQVINAVLLVEMEDDEEERQKIMIETALYDAFSEHTDYSEGTETFWYCVSDEERYQLLIMPY